jgi:hypothetical protein
VRDTEGSEHRDLAAAQHEATDTLTQMGRDTFPTNANHSVSIQIRDAAGKALLRVTLTHSIVPL